MSMVWVICGASKGVGKTHLALSLTELLPGSVYAKCGHCAPKAGKPKNYFQKREQLDAFIQAASRKRRHVVAESNSLAIDGGGDITVFIDGGAGGNRRPDVRQLRAAADVQICSGVSVKQWRRALHSTSLPASLCEAVCDLFVEQKRYTCSRGVQVRTKLWFEVAESHVLGSGLADLLESVHRCGTLRAAAEQVRMSYRHAWDMIAKAEKHLGKKLVLRHPGGRGGGGSALSQDGHRLLSVFRRLGDEVAKFADQRFGALCAEERMNV